jgi:Non-ribosomal peptide synthetase modules and related proteins
MLPLLTQSQWGSVETLIVAGDACPLALAQEWSQGRQFINAYGPSETTVCATLGEYREGDNLLHIGRPLQNVQVYVLNEERQLVPEGASGELYIGGVGLSKGYLNRENLTREKFVENPFYDVDNSAASERLYRTGDLVRWTSGENLEFLGRIDQQVKIRGFRIELGEIENTLISHQHVSDAIVTVWKMAEDDKRLVAYLVRTNSDETTLDQETLVEQLRQSLAARLPDYMMPSAFVCIDKIPLTPNGKVNRKALPEPDISQVTVTYIPPTTETEARLCELWQSILSVERIGIADNFFHRGGHSLLMLRLVKALEQEFSLTVSLKVMFQFPDLQSLAAYLELASSSDATDSDALGAQEELETFAI